MTSITPLALVVVSFWILVYIRRQYVLFSTKRSLLPVTASVHLRASRVLWTLGHYAEVDLTSPFILRSRTTLFVNSHEDLVEVLRRKSPFESLSPSRRQPAKPAGCCGWDWGSTMKTFYNLGSVTAIVGQALAVGVLWWSLLQLGLRLLGTYTPSTVITHDIVKRSPVPVPQSLNHSPNEFLLRPLIPGINLPFSHLPLIFFSLTVCTTIHEVGHAIAAAVDGVPLISWGYSLILVIPAAFVELAKPPSANRERAPLTRLRITSAGVYHNLITLLVLFFVAATSIGRMVWPVFGYRDIESGVVVVDVDVASPLRPHLFPGSIVTGINDARLAKSSDRTPQDLWSSFLLKGTMEDEKGWCVERHWLEDHSQDCCPRFSSHNNHDTGSCFISRPSGSMVPGGGWCLDPVPLFEDQTKQRCLAHTDCKAVRERSSVESESDSDINIAEERQAQMCITPHSSAELLRISFLRNDGGKDKKIIVWKGPRREVWEQVTVGKHLPRLRFLSLALPGAVELLVEYLRTVSLSLFFFNLLPIRILDGGEILSAFLQFIITVSFPWDNRSIALRRGDMDLEMGVRDRGNQQSTWMRRVQKLEGFIEIMTVVLIGVVSIGGLLVLGVG